MTDTLRDTESPHQRGTRHCPTRFREVQGHSSAFMSATNELDFWTLSTVAKRKSFDTEEVDPQSLQSSSATKFEIWKSG
ncbi:hypothetical protein VULLAG_LOCUS13791 [Vulpes lagopus]